MLVIFLIRVYLPCLAFSLGGSSPLASSSDRLADISGPPPVQVVDGPVENCYGPRYEDDDDHDDDDTSDEERQRVPSCVQKAERTHDVLVLDDVNVFSSNPTTPVEPVDLTAVVKGEVDIGVVEGADEYKCDWFRIMIIDINPFNESVIDEHIDSPNAVYEDPIVEAVNPGYFKRKVALLDTIQESSRHSTVG